MVSNMGHCGLYSVFSRYLSQRHEYSTRMKLPILNHLNPHRYQFVHHTILPLERFDREMGPSFLYSW